MTAWTHHDPAVRRLIREAQAVAWDEGYATCLGDFDIAARREAKSPNPYREDSGDLRASRDADGPEPHQDRARAAEAPRSDEETA